VEGKRRAVCSTAPAQFSLAKGMYIDSEAKQDKRSQWLSRLNRAPGKMTKSEQKENGRGEKIRTVWECAV